MWTYVSLMLLSRSSEMYYSPLGLRFCFYIENLTLFFGCDENFHEKLTLRKARGFVCCSFFLLSLFVLFWLCVWEGKLEAKRKNIDARHNNRCRKGTDRVRTAHNVGGLWWWSRTLAVSFSVRRRSRAERGQCGFWYCVNLNNKNAFCATSMLS